MMRESEGNGKGKQEDLVTNSRYWKHLGYYVTKTRSVHDINEGFSNARVYTDVLIIVARMTAF